jgi:hypothetical protein
VGENVEIGKLVRILKFLKNGDYVSKGSAIIDEEDQTKANQLRWGEELICHYRLNGDDPKRYNGTWIKTSLKKKMNRHLNMMKKSIMIFALTMMKLEKLMKTTGEIS